jgi:hypothetical protein
MLDGPFLIVFFQQLRDVIFPKIVKLNSAGIMEDIKLGIFQLQNGKSQSPEIFPDVIKFASRLNLNDGLAYFCGSFLFYSRRGTSMTLVSLEKSC